MINGKEYLVTTVNGFDRVQINNKLHDIGDAILNLKMEQDRLVQMRNLIDRQHEETDESFNDLFAELFGAWYTSPAHSTIACNTMKTVNVPLTTLETLIEGLESAVNVCYTAPSNPDEEGYPYATGYSRAAMQQTLKTLEALKTQAQ